MDKLSSAHIYLELRKDQTIDDIPQELVDDCVQLVKANSIQVNTIYLFIDNLLKCLSKKG